MNETGCTCSTQDGVYVLYFIWSLWICCHCITEVVKARQKRLKMTVPKIWTKHVSIGIIWIHKNYCGWDLVDKR